MAAPARNPDGSSAMRSGAWIGMCVPGRYPALFMRANGPPYRPTCQPGFPQWLRSVFPLPGAP